MNNFGYIKRNDFSKNKIKGCEHFLLAKRQDDKQGKIIFTTREFIFYYLSYDLKYLVF